jgi:hypothetical protein
MKISLTSASNSNHCTSPGIIQRPRFLDHLLPISIRFANRPEQARALPNHTGVARYKLRVSASCCPTTTSNHGSSFAQAFAVVVSSSKPFNMSGQELVD